LDEFAEFSRQTLKIYGNRWKMASSRLPRLRLIDLSG
jgi:hypothetical protein